MVHCIEHYDIHVYTMYIHVHIYTCTCKILDKHFIAVIPVCTCTCMYIYNVHVLASFQLVLTALLSSVRDQSVTIPSLILDNAVPFVQLVHCTCIYYEVYMYMYMYIL